MTVNDTATESNLAVGKAETSALIGTMQRRVALGDHERRDARYDPTESCVPDCRRCLDERLLCALQLLAAAQHAESCFTQRPGLASTLARRFKWERLREEDFVRLYHHACGVSDGAPVGHDPFTHDLAAQLFDDRTRMGSDTLVTRMEAEVAALVNTIALVKAAAHR